MLTNSPRVGANFHLAREERTTRESIRGHVLNDFSIMADDLRSGYGADSKWEDEFRAMLQTADPLCSFLLDEPILFP